MKNRITIVQLLNKIANGEEVPKQVKWLSDIQSFDTTVKDYVGNGSFLFQDNIMNFENVYDFLNLELEIVEDKHKEIQKLTVDDFDGLSCSQVQELLNINLNKVIDKVNQLEKEVINDND